jgi:hypothetical protein
MHASEGAADIMKIFYPVCMEELSRCNGENGERSQKKDIETGV